VQRLVRDLNRVYRQSPALHARDCEAEGFQWAIVDDHVNSVFAWVRRAPGARPVLIVANMTPVVRENYRVPLPEGGHWREIINSDAGVYGGSGKGNLGTVEAVDGAVHLTLPPLATLMLEHEGPYGP
jgi:1,4-alpha-glucan branching enzyme